MNPFIATDTRAPNFLGGAIWSLAFLCLACIGSCTEPEPLCRAAASGDLVGVKDLLGKGWDINAKDTNGWTPLLNAAFEGQNEALELLISHGAALDRKSSNGGSALQLAVDQNRIETVKRLIAHKVSVDERNNFGWSPLYGAAIDGNLDVVKLLVESGANPNGLGTTNEMKQVWNVLMAAAWKGHTKVVQYLLEKGADCNLKTPSGGSAFREIAKYPQPGALKLMLDAGAEVNSKELTGHTALTFAAYNGCLENVKILIAAGADLDATVIRSAPYRSSRIGGSFAYNAEIIAREQGHPEVAKFISAERARRRAPQREK
jgi:ankyrin repeat protein